MIPGPLRSFLRLAGISQQTTPDAVLPLLARNIFLHGHSGSQETEFLVLIDRYVKFAREIETLADADGTVRVADCGQAAKLVEALGYRFEQGCSRKNADLVTQNAERAFLTVDSGFPLTALEEALEKGTVFSYPFPSTPVPLLFTEKDWIAAASVKKAKTGETMLDLLLHNSDVDRLYSAMAASDEQTREALYRSPGLRKMLSVAPTFDFYGGKIRVRSEAVVLPGGENAAKDWQELVGASPQTPGDFVYRLLARDRGWLAAYFDAVSRLGPAQQSHMMEGDRLKQLYEAYRSYPSVPTSATGIFTRDTTLLLLLARLQWTANGDPDVPGDLSVWQEVLEREAKLYRGAAWSRHIPRLVTPNELVQELVATASSDSAVSPAQVYLALSAIDSARGSGARLTPASARLLAANFHQFASWYTIFVEFPALDNDAIADFINTANKIAVISDPALRSNALGTFQAEIGLWQILARQKEIPSDNLDSAWEKAVKPYGNIISSLQLFDAARESLKSIVAAAGGEQRISQDEIVSLLAGPSSNLPGDRRVHQALSDRISAVLEDQRLVSLDTLFGLYDGLDALAQGKPVGDTLVTLAGDLREFEMPRPIFTGGEKAAWSPIVYTSRHAELQVRTDLTKIIRNPGSPAQLEAARGRLTPFLRDTLVGLNYAYYEPPGAEVLHNNPLFVRSHDFSDESIEGAQQIWASPELIGVGVTAGGGAYLMGSLADLPYALAATEGDFIAPENVQALIWKETVPELLVGAVLPRWWSVTPTELHAAALYQRAGEELLIASAHDEKLRQNVLGILSSCVEAPQLEKIESAFQEQQDQAPQGVTAILGQILPADTFYLEAEFRKSFPNQVSQVGPANRELDALIQKDPADTAPARLSTDFGMPHPTMADSYSLSLLSTEPFPVSSGISSRLFGESWDSDNLFWARLADEKGYPPAMLNLLAPELTRRMIANMFATNIDDWPALMRAMTETGEQFRAGRIAIPAAVATAGNATVADGSMHYDQ